MSPRIVLVGAPGAGKTTVGRLLAERLGEPFRDTDADVEAVIGLAVADIFLEQGEPAFREYEQRAVAAAVLSHPGVLALGGGAVQDPRTRALLAGLPVAYLEVSAAEAATRVGLARDRPVLALNPRAGLRALLSQRDPVYREVSGVVVDTTGRAPGDVVASLVEWLGAGR